MLQSDRDYAARARGATQTETVVLISMVAIACLFAVTLFGRSVANRYQGATQKLQTAAATTDSGPALGGDGLASPGGGGGSGPSSTAAPDGPVLSVTPKNPGGGGGGGTGGTPGGTAGGSPDTGGNASGGAPPPRVVDAEAQNRFARAIQSELDGLSDSDRDDRSLELVNSLTDQQIRDLASTPEGKDALRRMVRELNGGNVTGDEARALLRVVRLVSPTHSRVADESLPPDVRDALNNAGATQQKPSEGWWLGSVRFDNYEVTLDSMPPGVTPEQFLANMARDMNGTINDSEFTSDGEFSRRVTNRDPRPGDIVDIDMWGPENGSVVLRESAPDHFVFTTIETNELGTHPLNGNREFGFRRNPDGSTTFYTRAADTVQNGTANFGDGIQDGMWRAAMRGISNQPGAVVRPNSVRVNRDPF
ncbi:MAG: hypothetical protein HYZ53_09030 [Planctomycetes bacterium]|nr:hypothetical protein [Planctomycetota bacterium]